MGIFGAGAAAGWSNPVTGRGPALRRSMDGWDDEELGKVYDHSVMVRLSPISPPTRSAPPWRFSA